MKYLITQEQRELMLSTLSLGELGYGRLGSMAASLKPIEPRTPTEVRAMEKFYPSEDLCGWSYRMGIADVENRILGEKYES